MRAQAEDRLARCLGMTSGQAVGPATRQKCVEESRNYCAASGLETSCGSSGLWTRGSSRWR
ncbi:MAG: hypothetical protein ACK4N5_17485 [Myxococcales bacterium]